MRKGVKKRKQKPQREKKNKRKYFWIIPSLITYQFQSLVVSLSDMQNRVFMLNIYNMWHLQG